MTDLAQQARRQFVAVADNAHAFAFDEAVVSIEDAVKVALAFRAAQPGEGLAKRCDEVLAWRKTGIYEGTELSEFALRAGRHDDGSEPSPARWAEDATVREALEACARAARPDREAVAAKAVAGALFEHISGKYGVRWEGVDLPEEYQFRGKAMGRLAGLRADAILALLTAEPAQEMREGECAVSPFGRHQVDTSMESGPNNCFFCEKPMGGR